MPGYSGTYPRLLPASKKPEEEDRLERGAGGRYRCEKLAQALPDNEAKYQGNGSEGAGESGENEHKTARSHSESPLRFRDEDRPGHDDRYRHAEQNAWN